MKMTASFSRNYIPVTESGCWIWTGSVDRDGYGLIRAGRKTLRAHRVSMLVNKQTDPIGRHVLHCCDVPSCVNPDHLFIGDAFVNQVDSFSKSRNSSAKVSHNDVLAIRLSDSPTAYLARKHSVSEWTIRRIRRKSTYKYVAR